MKRKRECLVRGNKIYFYGRFPERVAESAKLAALMAAKWLQKDLKNYLEYLNEKSRNRRSK